MRGLLHADADARAHAVTWMFAALNTVEPPILELVTARFAEGDKPWADERLPLVKDRSRDRLVQLSTHLNDADWLDGDFSAGDLIWCRCCSNFDPRAFYTTFRRWVLMLLAAKRGPHMNALSPPSGRSMPVIRPLGDEVLCRRRLKTGPPAPVEMWTT